MNMHVNGVYARYVFLLSFFCYVARVRARALYACTGQLQPWLQSYVKSALSPAHKLPAAGPLSLQQLGDSHYLVVLLELLISNFDNYIIVR